MKMKTQKAFHFHVFPIKTFTFTYLPLTITVLHMLYLKTTKYKTVIKMQEIKKKIGHNETARVNSSFEASPKTGYTLSMNWVVN